MKRQLLSLLNTPALSNFVDFLETYEGGSSKLLRILTYHRVDELSANPHLSPTLLSATPKDFSEQMHMIRERYEPVGIEQVLSALSGNSNLPKRAVLVTFDDAYRDFKENAWPILQMYSIPTVLFVPTAYPDHPERSLWWDTLYYVLTSTSHNFVYIDGKLLDLSDIGKRQQTYRQIRNQIKNLDHKSAMLLVDKFLKKLEVAPISDNHILNWDDIRQLASSGVAIGAHTRAHPLLRRISVKEAVREARQSYEDLIQELGSEPPPIFAYPSGDASDVLAQHLNHAGFKAAFTTTRGINRIGNDNAMLLKRINIGRNTSINAMQIQMFRSVGYFQDLLTQFNQREFKIRHPLKTPCKNI